MKPAIVCAFVVLCACTTDQPVQFQQGSWTEVPNRYARCFSVFARGAERKVIVFGPAGRTDTAAVLYLGDQVVMHGALALPELKRIAVLSTTHLAYISALSRTDIVVAAAYLDRVRDRAARERIAKGSVIEIATADGIDREQLLRSRAQVIFDYPFGQAAHRATLKDLTFVPVTEYLEEHPLGRAEWIRFFGVLLNAEDRADSLYNAIESRYTQNVSMVSGEREKPRVFFGSAWQGQWHVPPGNSYMAALIKDSGGDYFFADRRSGGNIAIDLETVMVHAREADRFGAVLGQHGDVHALDVAGGDVRVAALPVFAHDAFYMDSERSDIFGQALLEPDVLLLDMIGVLHRSKLRAPPKYIFQPAQ